MFRLRCSGLVTGFLVVVIATCFAITRSASNAFEPQTAPESGLLARVHELERITEATKAQLAAAEKQRIESAAGIAKVLNSLQEQPRVRKFGAFTVQRYSGAYGSHSQPVNLPPDLLGRWKADAECASVFLSVDATGDVPPEELLPSVNWSKTETGITITTRHSLAVSTAGFALAVNPAGHVPLVRTGAPLTVHYVVVEKP